MEAGQSILFTYIIHHFDFKSENFYYHNKPRA